VQTGTKTGENIKNDGFPLLASGFGKKATVAVFKLSLPRRALTHTSESMLAMLNKGD
jgi:hypothetical protein